MRRSQSRPLTVKEAIALLNKKEVRRSKHGVRLDDAGKELRTYKGQLYDSQFECDYAKNLDLRLAAGEIASWSYHKLRFPLNAEGGKKVATYTPDFEVVYHDGTRQIIETKGWATPLFRRSMNHMKAQYGDSVPITIVYQEKPTKKRRK